MKIVFQKIIKIMLIISLISISNVSYAVTQAEINKQKSEQSTIQSQLNQLEEKKDEIKEEKTEVLKEMQGLTTKIDSYESEISSLEKQVEEANKKIEEAEKKLKEAEEKYTKKQQMLEQRMVAIYEAGETSYLDVLLRSENLTDFISNYYLVSELTEHDMDLLEKIQKEKEEMEALKKDIEANKQSLIEMKASKEKLAAELKSAKDEKNEKAKELTKEEKELQGEIEDLQAENKRIKNEIAAAEAKYQAELNALKASSSVSSITAGSGFLMKPVNGGYISTGSHYSSGKFHGGIDYAISSGTPVFAAATGVVMYTANLRSSYGTYVVIRHANGLQTYYAHGTPGSICVSPGQTVTKGQKIMLSGNSGNSSGPHLHFEVRTSPYNYNGYATGYGQDSRVNPLAYM